jgi:Tfp pilus assembly protein PilV
MHGKSTRGDRGETLIELLIAVVLLGSVVGATLVAMSTTVRSTLWERERATAQMWIQSAVEALEETTALDCNEDGRTEVSLRADYEAAIRSSVEPPPGWSAEQIRVVPPVLFWDTNNQFQSVCYDDVGLDLQLVEIEVSSSGGSVVESVEVVIGSG